MSLDAYIANSEKRADLAQKLGTNPQYLWQIATGWRGRRASPAMAQRIEEATQGEVTKEQLRPDIWPPQAREKKPKVADGQKRKAA